MDVFRIKNKILCDFLIINNFKEAHNLIDHLQSEYDFTPEQSEAVRKKLQSDGFIKKAHKKFINALSNAQTFNVAQEVWLNSDFVVKFSEEYTTKRSRPSCQDFKVSSTSTKRRKLLQKRKITQIQRFRRLLYIFLKKMERKEW